MKNALTDVVKISAVLLATLLIAHALRPPPSAQSILAELAVARGYRVIEPRLSIATPYAPFRAIAANTRESSLPFALRQNANSIALRAHPGVTNLMLGEWSRAIATLERSRSAASKVDLAAAYYMRGLATDSLRDYCRAFHVLRVAGDSPAAIFNRALILEQLSDRQAAADQWKRYLARDAQSPWAAEARRRLAQDRRPSVATMWQSDKERLRKAAMAGDAATVRALALRYPLGTRQFVEYDLLPEWGRARVANQSSEAAKAMAAARLIVSQRRNQDDFLLSDMIAEIDAADRSATQAIARAFALYGDGFASLQKSAFENAVAQFKRALDIGKVSAILPAIISPNTITAYYRYYDFGHGDSEIAELRKRYAAQATRYPSLFARLDWLAGLIEIARPDPTLSLRSYESAQRVYDHLGETEYQGAQHINRADTYAYLGDTERAGMHTLLALRYVSEAEDPLRLQGTLKVAARFAMENDSSETALTFLNHLVSVVRTVNDPMRLPDALVARSAMLSRAGRIDEALRDAAEVRSLVVRIPNRQTQQRLEADASMAEAYAYRDRDDQQVIESLSRAIAIFRQLQMHAFHAQLRLERGRTFLRIGDATAAERDFREAIGIYEQQRRIVQDPRLRISYLDRADRTFAELAALLVSHGRVDEAFNLLERFRARELLDDTSRKTLQPLVVADVRQRLPRDTILVSHTLHAHGLLTFVVTRDTVRGFDTRMDGGEIGALIDKIGIAFDGSRPLPQDALRRLGHLLIDPIAPPAHSRIVFIPDESLARVPYAALQLADGTSVLEHHITSQVPSATLMAWSLSTDHARSLSAAQSILIVASSEQPAGSDLPPLVRTVAEARSIARRYPHSKILSGDSAGHVLAAARNFDVLHFAAHSIVDVREPANSALLLGPLGRLTAKQIHSADLSNLELVVLGGCNTGVGRNYRSEGTMSLARAFMAASAPAVVSTIAPIDDDTARQFLSEFHRGYAVHSDAPRALHEAQRSMARTKDATHWAAFQLVGVAPMRREP